MSKLGYLLLVWAICEGVICEEEHQRGGFVETLDFSPIFQSGPTSLASGPLSSAILKADKSQYPQLFDAIVSSSIDSLQTRVAPRDTFSADRFGFNPIASSGFLSGVKSAKLVAKPKPQPQHHAQRLQAVPIQQRVSPLQLYDIRTVHDADYKVYKPEENEQQEILASLRRDPSVAAYFKPAATNIEVAHPLKYRTEQPSENAESLEQNYRPNAYIAGPSRIRRYTDGRRSERLRKSSEEDEEAEEPYYYKPKAFDGGHYSSNYKQEKDPNKEYDYPYDYDSGYDHKEYERIKEISEQQAAEIKQNPENCKEVIKDSMKCVTCKDPKTGGNFESCSYVAEPKNNKYAYSKERKFDSNDEPDAPKTAAPKPAKYEEEKDDKDESPQYEKLTSAPEEKYHSQYKKSEDDDDDSEDDKDDKGKYKAYYVHNSKPGGKPSAALTQASDEESEDKSDAVSKPYNYKKAIPGFYTDNNPKKDVEHVLAEFKKKDRSACKKVQKNGMTCFQCIDSNGLKNEECMYVSESAPQRSHLAYQELKEFTSKPATLAGGSNDEAESQIVTTSFPPLATPQKSAAYVQTNSYGRKLKRKKAPQAAAVAAADSPVTFTTPLAVPTQQPTRARKAKRSEQSVQEGEERAAIVDETNIAPPEEFAGASSHGAFWAETMPRYSAALGVTLPEYMLARSEHEASFDEAVAGA